MNWVNRSLFNKLLAIITGGCLLILIAGAYYFQRVNHSINQYNQLIASEIAIERQISLMSNEFKTQIQEWKNVLLRGHDPAQLDRFWTSFQHQERLVQDIGARVLPMMSEGPERQLVQEFLQAHRTMGERYRGGLEDFRASGFNHIAGDAAVAGMDREPTRLLNAAATALSNYAVERSDQIPDEVSSATLLAGALLMAAILAFGTVAMLVVNSAIVKPSRSLIGAIHALSQGQLDNNIDIRRQDELGVLASAARELQSFLAAIAKEMHQTSDALDNATESLVTASNAIVEHTNGANDSTAQVATAMEEMASAAQEVSNHAQDAASLANQANEAAMTGLKAMDEARSSIDRLAEQIGSSMKTVDKLETETANIGNVLDVIKAIAEQTNLLALNAAIEAARAGEQGRGFAVVADEVRSLAQRTQTSTQEIQGIIESVQSGARDTVTVMKQSRDISQQSVSTFNESAEQLHNVTNAIGDINTINTQVATASEEQTSVAGDIAKNISSVAEQTEETATTARSLNGISATLQEMVRRNRELSGRFSGVTG
ncbi:methyl-accepting chemotaxis protein [Salinispirillum sp. LH 10-3-1]|uniref:Methyl-accepting chemotaxis protein n=1 Tax=Salinispirillum sp. LH 10-3-1 TaxID=2952525 RepID=A0AB38YHB8_9GAMM